MKIPIISLRLQQEQDLVPVRQRARQVAALVGFESQDQTRIATAVSEIARNAFRYAGGGKVEFALSSAGAPQSLLIRVSDEGPGIADLAAVLQGRYKSETGMGLGIQGARRLMDQVDIETTPGKGTNVLITKHLPRRQKALTTSRIAAIASELASSEPQNPYEEVQTQNQELLRTLSELRHRQEEMAQLNRELEDTNRGVLALYAELDEKAEHLKRADQLKSTFLSHMSHEFRTPLNSVTALSRILLSRLDGPLTPEQEKQVSFIHQASQELTDLVNDLLDLAKVEAGKIELYPTDWQLTTLFGALRGMLRPLLANSPVQLNIEDPPPTLHLHTDEGKVAQILRNFVSNAIKFTDEGEIRVVSRHDAATDTVHISVTDSGIGIAPEDQARIFDQYVQLNSVRRKTARGTGLGLPLSKKLAELLGGNITVESTPGSGSKFTLQLPRVLGKTSALPSSLGALSRILVIDDEEVARYLVRKQLGGLDVEIQEADGGAEGVRIAMEQQPDLIVLDLVMPPPDGFEVLERLKSDPVTANIPVVVHTSKTMRGWDRERLSRHAVAIVRKSGAQANELRTTIEQLARTRTS